MLSLQTSIPISDQVLTLDGRPVGELLTVQAAGIADGNVVYVSRKPRFVSEAERLIAEVGLGCLCI